MSNSSKLTEAEADALRDRICELDSQMGFVGWLICAGKFDAGVAKEIRNYVADLDESEKRRAAREKQEVGS